jgi:hypothetical protein
MTSTLSPAAELTDEGRLVGDTGPDGTVMRVMLMVLVMA